MLQVKPALEPQDCACAVSFLWWSQPLAADQKLWDVVCQAGKSLKDQKAKQSGLLFWDLVEKEEWTPPYSVSQTASLVQTHTLERHHHMPLRRTSVLATPLNWTHC